jgi:hypothetical protein
LAVVTAAGEDHELVPELHTDCTYTWYAVFGSKPVRLVVPPVTPVMSVPEPWAKPLRPYSTLLLVAELGAVHVTVVDVHVVLPEALTPTGTAQGEHCATKLFHATPATRVEL